MKQRKRLVLGTRGSKLALWQAEMVAEALRASSGVEVELRTIKTQGDKILDSPLARIGGKGLFVKEIELALMAGEVDFAVHSLKDVPTEVPEPLCLAAMIERHDPRDALISRGGAVLESLRHGAIIGTSSLRRQAQLLNHRPDFLIKDLRGNLDTRLRKVESGEFDAAVLSAAGLMRMGWQDRITALIPIEISLPAVGQGTVAIEARNEDEQVLGLVGELNHHATELATRAERAFLRRLEGGCQVPIGALGRVEGRRLSLDGMVASLDGSKLIRDRLVSDLDGLGEPEELGLALAERLLTQGAGEVLAEVRAQASVT